VGSGKPGWLASKFTGQLLVYADDVNTLGVNTHTIKKNTETLIVASKERDPKVNAESTKYMATYVSRSECRTKSQHKD
jgi:hypothetical protein